MESRIESVENLSSDKLVISINYHQELASFAVSSDCLYYILHVVYPLSILDEDYFISLEFAQFIQLMFDTQSSAVFWCIIYDDNVIVCVILLENRVKIEVVPEIWKVLECRYNDTNG